MSFDLYHNSLSLYSGEMGPKWTHSFDISLTVSSMNPTINWGDGRGYTFTYVTGGTYTPPAGTHDTLVANGSPTITSWDLTTHDQIKYHFTQPNSSGWYCTSIKDPNSNQISLSYNAGNQVTSVSDAAGRSLSLSYTSGKLTSVSDPLSRSWSLTYTSGKLTEVTWPTVGGSSYNEQFAYNSTNDITTLTDKRGNNWTAAYNSSDQVTSETDPLSHQTTIGYPSSTETTVTDPNSHEQIFNYNSSGLETSWEDENSKTETYTWDSNVNRTKVVDRRSNSWNYTFDSNGNMLTAEDPNLNTVTWTFNSKNRVLTETRPLGDETVNTYDTTLNWNLTETEEETSGATVLSTTQYTYNSDGTPATKEDSNSHTYSYGYDSSGYGQLISLTTPNSHETQWTYDALGVTTGRTDALSRATSYTLDNWERVTTVTYPDSSTHTFTYDANSNLTQFVDGTGTTTRAYDTANRMTSESFGGSTVVTYAYDATGQKGLLSSVTDSNSRAITYSYTNRNQLSGISETTGSVSYTYDNNENETGITNENGTTVTNVFDVANRLTSVTNATSGATTISSFSYMLDNNDRRTAVSENGGASSVSYGYDGIGRLTSESRTGTNAYSMSYGVDGVGNRTSETIGGTTTSFTLDNDDELTSTSGGFANSYSYDANGQQTGRTLAGTSYTLAYDYDGQLTSISSGGSTLVSYAYDALGRRYSRTASGTTTVFQYAGSKVLVEKQGSTYTAAYSYGNALVRKDGEYPLFDGQGSERTVTNSSQSTTGTLNLDAFGNSVGSTGSSTNPYMYAATSGYRNDGDAGLTLVGARYYDSQVGRFVTRDTYLDQAPYAYCEHDPANNVDPDGHDDSQHGANNIGGGGDSIYGLSDEDLDKMYKDPKTSKADKLKIKAVQKARGTRKSRQKNNKKFDISPVLEPVWTTVAVVRTGYLIWEGFKWGAAVIAAPETGGGSLGLAGALP